MIGPPIPEFEEGRLAAVQRMQILDTPPDPWFDALTREAIEKLHVPISAVSIIDKDREWFKSCQGIVNRQGPRTTSFCGHALVANSIFVIEDTLLDPRFADNPQVVNPPHIRFYAGLALYDRQTNMPIGVFCVKDTKPRKLSAEEIGILFDLAKRASSILNENTKFTHGA